MPGLDHRADQTGNADAVTAHFRNDLGAIRPGDAHTHRFGVFGAEIEDMAHLDAAPLALALLRHAGPCGQIVLFLGGGIKTGHLFVEGVQIGRLVVIERGMHPVGVLKLTIVEHLAFTCGCQHDEFMGKLAADRAGISNHRNRLQSHALESAHIGKHHLAVADHGGGVVEIEAVRILHQEFAPPHHPEARTDFVAKLPLNMIQRLRQFTI